MRILFLTSHNLATNPRLVKEIRLALNNNYEVEVICFEFDGWSRDINSRLVSEFPEAKFYRLGLLKKLSIQRVWEKAKRILIRFLSQTFIADDAAWEVMFPRSRMLMKQISKVSKPDIVIGHNPAALLPALFAASKYSCKKGFDMEDYHSGESNDAYVQMLTKRMLKSQLNSFDYVSFSSCLMMEELKKDKEYETANWIEVLNFFPSVEFLQPMIQKPGSKIKLVWFSQNINNDRGLEIMITAAEKHKDEVELHLIGQVASGFTKFLSGENIHIHSPLAEKDLHHKLSEFDVGLALEPGKDLNNNLAISNKILAYLQAGLYILATDTPGQRRVLETYPMHGICFSKSDDVSVVLQNVISNITEIRLQSQQRYFNASITSWETESVPLLRRWQSFSTA